MVTRDFRGSVPKEVVLSGRCFRLFRSPEQIQERVCQLARVIPSDALVVPLLTGAALFGADLVRYVLHQNLYLAYVKVSSYRGQTESQQVPEVQGLDVRTLPVDSVSSVFLVDTIADSGKTFQVVRQWFRQHYSLVCPIYTLALFVKPRAQEVTDFFGEQIAQDLFLVGYGLDYREKGRNLPAIYVATKSSFREDGNF